MKPANEMTREELLNAHADYQLPKTDLADNDVELVTVCMSTTVDDGIAIYQRDYDDRDGSLINDGGASIYLHVEDGSIGKLRDSLNRWYPDAPSEPVKDGE